MICGLQIAAAAPSPPGIRAGRRRWGAGAETVGRTGRFESKIVRQAEQVHVGHLPQRPQRSDQVERRYAGVGQLGDDGSGGGAQVSQLCSLALATDCNPGCSFTTSMPFGIVVATRDTDFTPAQALWSAKAGGAAALRVRTSACCRQGGVRT